MLFDKKQKQALQRGLAHCQTCEQLTSALRQMGVPNEVLEEQNKFNKGVLEKALELDRQYANQQGSN